MNIKKVKSQKGVTMMILVITIMVLMILSFQVYYNVRPTMEIRTYENFRVDIAKIDAFVEDYYKRNNKLPVLEKYKGNISMLDEIKNPNDGEIYYVLNLDEMISEAGHKDTTYLGNEGYSDYKNGNKNNQDIYIINHQSHTVYYLLGVELDGETIYTMN